MIRIAKWILAMMPLVIFGILYFAIGIFPPHHFNSVDIRGLHDAELHLWGIVPSEWFAVHNCASVDVFAGIFYLLWIPLPIIFSIIIFYQRQYKWVLHFSCAFLLTNIIGFCGYYLHPAAPPWYVMDNGFDLDLTVVSTSAGLARFDELIGIPVFGSIYLENANIFGAVPSLHAAYMTVATIYAFASRQKVWLKALFIFVTVGIWFTAVYSGHHYTIDVILGIMTAIVGVVVFEKVLMRIPRFEHFMKKYERQVIINN